MTTGNILFGLQAGAVLSTVVGVLMEVPVTLSIVCRARAWYERI